MNIALRRNILGVNMVAFGQGQGPELFRLLLISVGLALIVTTAIFVFSGRAKGARIDPALLMLTPKDPLTSHQAYEGVFAVGGTGSGKSSTLAHLMAAYMKRRAGMLILTANVEDFAHVLKLARENGRGADVIRFSPGGEYRFDFLNHELTSPGGSVATASALMQDIVDFSTRTQSQSTPDPFWPLASAEQIKAAISVVFHATGRCSVADVYSLITTMPATIEEVNTPEFAQSECGKFLLAAEAKGENPDVTLAADYILRGWPKMGERTQGNVAANTRNCLGRFMHGQIRELVASGVTNCSPQDVLDGKIVVIDTPVLKYREPGQFVQIVWKLALQRAALRRETPDKDIVLWADEAQLHALPTDSGVQAVARKHKLVNVAITQNLPLLFSVLKNRDDAIAWVSNLQTKFIFANGDRETNEYWSALFGQSKQLLGSSSLSTKPYDMVNDMLGSPEQGNYSVSEHFLPDVRPEAFTKLRKGSRENSLIVECFIFQGGRIFSNGKTWLKASFKQLS
jgi:hypothetical protein